MKAFFGAVAKNNIIRDVYYGLDYHSHLGTASGNFLFCQTGLSVILRKIGDSSHRRNFTDLLKQDSNCALGYVNDGVQDLLIEQDTDGQFALATFGSVDNAQELSIKFLDGKAYSNDQLVAKLVKLKKSLLAGLVFVRECIKGSLTIWVLHSSGTLYAVRDNVGRFPVFVGRKQNGYCISLEQFVCDKLGYEAMLLKEGEIAEITANNCIVIPYTPLCKRKCAFMWIYYGHPASTYDSINVEQSRYNGGAKLAGLDKELKVDCVCGIPDSGTAYAIGYANTRNLPLVRPFIKYNVTWSRSFISSMKQERDNVAKMKQIMIPALIKDKSIVVIDDSVVRGTQLKAIIALLRNSGAGQVHLRIASPPMLFSCQYLQNSALNESIDLLAPQVLVGLCDKNIVPKDVWRLYEKNREKYEQKFCKIFGVDSVHFQSLEDMIDAIGINKNDTCTYCWTGKD